MRLFIKLVSVSIFFTLSFSCTKSIDSGYYFEAKIGGQTQTFNTAVTAITYSDGAGEGTNQYHLQISGVTGITSYSASAASLLISSQTPNFTAGNSFTIATAPPGSFNELIYSPPQVGSTLGVNWSSEFADIPQNKTLNCTINEATTSYIRGTFSAVIYQNNSSGVIGQNVTSGRFYAKFVAP